MRVLVLTAEPIAADLLREAIGEQEAAEAEVLVVSPAYQESRLRFWFADVDDAIAKAEVVQQESVERLEEEGIDASGDTGESDPLVAVHDALATFEADRIVVFSHPEGERAYREELVEELGRRFALPVTQRVVTRSDSDAAVQSAAAGADAPTRAGEQDDEQAPTSERLSTRE